LSTFDFQNDWRTINTIVKTNMKKELPAFSCSYSKNIPSLLRTLNCSLAISTYQAGKVILISPDMEDKLVQLPRNFDKAMGISIHGKRMAVATRDKVHVLANNPDLAPSYPKKTGRYDAIFLPRTTYYTGMVDMHDIHLTSSKLYAINTSFSCLVELNDNYSWNPIWKPAQIDALASEDRCHLNGLAVDEDENPAYATSLGNGNTLQSWRKMIPGGGRLYDLQADKTLLKDLQMPHSPRIYSQRLFFLESARGLVQEFDRRKNRVSTIAQIPAFLRGLAIYKDFIFVGKSQLRSTSKIFNQLELAKNDIVPGVTIIHLPSGKIVGDINYLSSVEEIYDIQVLPGTLRPNVINPSSDITPLAISTPTATFWAKRKK
jgi:uncharacterized protein (TIGR03032 family)